LLFDNAISFKFAFSYLASNISVARNSAALIESGSVDLNTFSEIFNVCAVLLYDVCGAHDFCAFWGLIDGFVRSSPFCV